MLVPWWEHEPFAMMWHWFPVAVWVDVASAGQQWLQIWKTIHLFKSCCMLRWLIITNQVHLTNFKVDLSVLNESHSHCFMVNVCLQLNVCCNSEKEKQAFATISMCQGHVQTATTQLLNAQLLFRWTRSLQRGNMLSSSQMSDQIFCPLCMLTLSILIRLFASPSLVRVNLYSSAQTTVATAAATAATNRGSTSRDSTVASTGTTLWFHFISGNTTLEQSSANKNGCKLRHFRSCFYVRIHTPQKRRHGGFECTH